jgi:hypothetical protein
VQHLQPVAQPVAQPQSHPQSHLPLQPVQPPPRQQVAQQAQAQAPWKNSSMLHQNPHPLQPRHLRRLQQHRQSPR